MTRRSPLPSKSHCRQLSLSHVRSAAFGFTGFRGQSLGNPASYWRSRHKLQGCVASSVGIVEE